MKYDIAVIGAGPAGLRCAELLAGNGASVIVLERQPTIGKKVCAGGITWDGLISRVPASLVERSFDRQTIITPRQHVLVASEHPMVATVKRESLGRHMAERAREQGACLITGARVLRVDGGSLTYCRDKREESIRFSFLVGADGAQSLVRSYLKLPVKRIGIGLNLNIPVTRDAMIWNFDARRFGSGYTWIFPHRDYCSVGFFATDLPFPLSTFKAHLLNWLQEQDINAGTEKIQAGKINCDFRGWRFGRVFLAGDAAGLASPLTGEGIFPAIVSAEAIAGSILGWDQSDVAVNQLIKKHDRHGKMVALANRSARVAAVLIELSALLLRYRLLSFRHFEMA